MVTCQDAECRDSARHLSLLVDCVTMGQLARDRGDVREAVVNDWIARVAAFRLRLALHVEAPS